MGEISALLRIEVKQIGSPTVLEIRGNGQKHTIESHAVDLKTMREDLRDHIKALKTQISYVYADLYDKESGKPFDLGKYDIEKLSNVVEALRRLHSWGVVSYSDFFEEDPNPKKRGAVLELFDEFYHRFNDPGAGAGQGVVEIISNLNHTIPFEFFVFPTGPSRIRTKDDLQEVVKRFFGFRFIINRITNSREERVQNRKIDNSSKLTLKYFFNKDIRKDVYRTELDFFQNCGHFHLKGPWPQNQVQDFIEKLAFHIFHPDRDFNGTERELDQVHHFLCHCDTTADSSKRHCLQFCQDQEASLMELQEYRRYLSPPVERGEDRKDMPVVFLNACGSSVIMPQSMSFPKFFLEKNRNPSFVGTEANVPQFFAPEFSKCFYKYLLAGKSLGNALQLAKWEMLSFTNPLGMLYTLYGNPDLSVKNPVELEYIKDR